MKFICTLFFACWLTNALSQTLLKPIVEIDVRSGAFKTSLPFDESFTIKGELAYSTRKVIVKYGPLDKKKVANYFSRSTVLNEKYKTDPILEYSHEYWVKKGETEFTISEVGPLRPNTPYRFKFLTLTKNNVAVPQLSFLRDEINKELTTLLLDKKTLTLEDMSSIYDDLIKLATEVTNDNDLVDEKSEPFSIQNYKKNLNLFSYRLLSLHNEINGQNAALVSAIDSSGSGSLSGNFNLLLPKIGEINSGVVRLSPYARQALSSAIDNSQETGVPRQPLPYLQSLFLNKDAFRQTILNETGNIADSTISINISTVETLTNILNVLKSNQFTKQDNSRVFNDQEVNAINRILEKMSTILAGQRTLAANNQRLFSLKSDLSSVLINAYLDESYVLASVAEFDVVPKPGPYVGLDAGVMMAFNPYKNTEGVIGNSTYFAIQEGVNIYFSPINKRVPLSAFKWPYKFYKSFNLHVGLAQVLGGYNTYRLDNSLGKILGNVVVGFGFRFNSVARFGLNAMFVNLNDINPTVSRSTLKPMLGASFSFDIGVGNSINKLAKRNQEK